MRKLLLIIYLISSSTAFARNSQNLFRICDSLAMQPPVIREMKRSDKARYSVKNLDYGMTIGIERTPGGRIWNCFVSGGDDANAFFVLNWSDDSGRRWSDVKFIIDPHDDSLPLKRRTIVGQLWTDPLGRLWLFMDQSMTYFDGRSGLWCAVCENPDAARPVWSESRYIGFGCSLNKPIVLSNGEWVLPVSLWTRRIINVAKEPGWKRSPLSEAHHELDPVRGAHTFVSSDQGVTWEDRGFVLMPKPSFDEHQYVELDDGRIWMTARTGEGICSSYSSDGGRSWTTPERYQPHIDSRHFMTRLQSGNILLIRHGYTDEKTKKRSHLRAFISTDEGLTWQGGLLLDERAAVSYPTGFQAPDGYIFISYDYERAKAGELYLSRFTEEDIFAGKIVSKKGYVRRLILRPGRIEYTTARW